MAIDAARVQIRPWRLDDTDALHRLVRASQASLSRWLAWCHADYGRDDAHAWIDHSMASWKQRSAFPFAVTDGDGEILFGGVGLSQLDTEAGTANLGYWVGSPFVGHGYATTAAKLAARFGFDELKLRHIELRVLPDNHASLAVARKLGAKHEGIVRDGIVQHGEPRDAQLYSLTSGDIA